MTVNYSISFLLNGVWTEDYFFKRDLFEDNPLDEALDTSVVVDIPSDLLVIPPFTVCRIISSYTVNQDTVQRKQYYLTGNRESTATTLFKPSAICT